MDYKEKYEELVEAARAVVEGNPGLCDMNKRLCRVRDLLPEKESEDERIRKSLIKFFNGLKGSDMWDEHFTISEILAYLEKQKELLTPEEKMKHPLYVEGFEAGKQIGTQYEAVFGKQKEQKPAEWSEEDRKHLDWIIEHFRQGGSLYDNLIHWLTQLPKRFNLQSQKEWSELQSEFKNINEAFEDGKKEVVTHPKKYGLCKPTEWSEEDEKFIKELCNLLASIAKNNYVGRYYAPDLVNKLQSLRPQPNTMSVENVIKFGNLEYERGVKDGIQSKKSRNWKPSEEQVDALKYALGNGGKYDKEALESLFHDLKSL